MSENGTYELVVDEGDGEELVATGSKRQMEADRHHLLGDYEPGGEQYGTPPPPYRVQRAA